MHVWRHYSIQTDSMVHDNWYIKKRCHTCCQTSSTSMAMCLQCGRRPFIVCKQTALKEKFCSFWNSAAINLKWHFHKQKLCNWKRKFLFTILSWTTELTNKWQLGFMGLLSKPIYDLALVCSSIRQLGIFQLQLVRFATVWQLHMIRWGDFNPIMVPGSTIRYFQIAIQGHWNDLHSNMWAATHHFASGLGMPLAWTSYAVDSDSYTSLSTISVPIIWGTAEKVNKPTKIFFTHSTIISIQTVYTKCNITLTFLSTSLKRNISLWQQHSSAWLSFEW